KRVGAYYDLKTAGGAVVLQMPMAKAGAARLPAHESIPLVPLARVIEVEEISTREAGGGAGDAAARGRPRARGKVPPFTLPPSEGFGREGRGPFVGPEGAPAGTVQFPAGPAGAGAFVCEPFEEEPAVDELGEEG